jgi:hypothetical protein
MVEWKERPMPYWVWIIIGVVVVVVLVLLVVTLLQRNRTTALKRRFGPEYDRTVSDAGQREGETILRTRERQRDRLDIRPLDPAHREQFVVQWRDIQHTFVDQPSRAVRDASALLTEVMARRGYPVDNFDERAELISVDHPRLVQDYRVAQAIRERNSRNEATTEELREALLRYRSCSPSCWTRSRRGTVRERNPAAPRTADGRMEWMNGERTADARHRRPGRRRR